MALDAFYLWDSMATWAVRAQDGVVELNPLILRLQQIDPLFYVAFRAGAFLLLNVLLWQIYIESPRIMEGRWFEVLVTAGLVIYAIPLVMSLWLFV
jgi:hypothetical protein